MYKRQGERSIDLFAAQADSGVNVSLKESGKYTIEVAVDVRMLEVVIELDEENSTLYIDPEKLTYLTEDGRIVTPTGEAHRREGTLVTPGGAVVSADGTVIAPASEGPLGIALLTPENEVVYPDQDQSLDVYKRQIYDITHGLGLAIVTPRWMRYVLDVTTAHRFYQYGVNVFGIDPSLPEMEVAEKSIEMTADFLFGKLGLASTLTEIGIDDSNFDIMAEKACGGGILQGYKPLNLSLIHI